MPAGDIPGEKLEGIRAVSSLDRNCSLSIDACRMGISAGGSARLSGLEKLNAGLESRLALAETSEQTDGDLGMNGEIGDVDRPLLDESLRKLFLSDGPVGADSSSEPSADIDLRLGIFGENGDRGGARARTSYDRCCDIESILGRLDRRDGERFCTLPLGSWAIGPGDSSVRLRIMIFPSSPGFRPRVTSSSSS